MSHYYQSLSISTTLIGTLSKQQISNRLRAIQIINTKISIESHWYSRLSMHSNSIDYYYHYINPTTSIVSY
jgi:hypothetical protein